MDIPFLANQDHSVNPWFDIFPTCKTSQGCGTQLQNYTLHSARFFENACLILLTFQFVNFNAISTDKLKTMRIPAALNQPRQSQAHSFRRNWHDVTWKLICHEYILYVFFCQRDTIDNCKKYKCWVSAKPTTRYIHVFAKISPCLWVIKHPYIIMFQSVIVTIVIVGYNRCITYINYINTLL